MIYLRPKSLEQATAALAEYGQTGRLLAGGTDLLIAMRRGIAQPETIIDITCLDELRGIRHENGLITIGALTSHSQIRNSLELAVLAPLLVHACRDIGSVQIRNLATIGGNLGNASPAGDSLPALYVLNSQIQLISQDRECWVNIENFFTGPGKTVRRPDEMITAVRFQPLIGAWKTFFTKLGQRRALRVAKVSAAGAIAVEGDRVVDCRLALGSVAPTVIRIPAAERVLKGACLDMDLIAKAAELAEQASSPISDIRSTIDYRRSMVKVLVRRELEKIAKEAKL